MSFEAPPSYSEVVGETVPSAPPIPIAIAIAPVSPVIEPAHIGFAALNEPSEPARVAKEREAAGLAPPAGPGFDPEDDITPVRQSEPVIPTPEQQGGKREFVIRLTCPSCDCSKLVPRCNNLACCKPDFEFLDKLKYKDTADEKKLFRNYYWSKIADRHFRYFFRRPEEADIEFAQYVNGFLYIVFLVITTVMFLITPWIALISAVILPCDENSAIKPLIGSFGAVVLAESFMRSCCYFLHKIDRPPRAIKELESPNPLFFVIIGLSIAIFVNCGMTTNCGNSTILINISPDNGTCCDPALISIGYAVPIAWVVFQGLVMLGTSAKFLFDF